MLRWPGNVVHLVWLVVVTGALGLAYAIGRLIHAAVIWGPRRPRALARLRGVVLRHAMTALGATFIKLGQVMSTRPDLFAPELIDELRRLQDRLPAFAFSAVRAAVEAELRAPLAARFRAFDAVPVAAASVAQVHRAELTDGTEVAVKVLRPGVRRQVERDRAILLAGARVIALVPRWRASDPVGHIRHFVEAIHAQTDLRHEADNAERFRANFATTPRIAFPRIHRALSGERVLTMEFVRGTKIDALPADMSAERKGRIAETLRLAMFQMCFHDGFVHADLHPGNVVVTADDTLVLFDAGLAKLLHDDVLLQFIDMSKCLAMGTADDLVAHLRRFHTYLGPVDWDALRAAVGAFATRFRSQAVGRLEYGELIGEMFAIGRAYRVHPVTDMTLVFVALITAQGIGKMLEPEHNVFTTVAQHLIPILVRRNEHVPDTAEARAARAAEPPPTEPR